MPNAPDRRGGNLLWDGVRGHFLLLDKLPTRSFDAATMLRCVLFVVFLEAVIRPLLTIWIPRYSFVAPRFDHLLIVGALLIITLISQRSACGITLRDVGIHAVGKWPRAQFFYCGEVALLATVIFTLLHWPRLARSLSHAGEIFVFTVLVNLGWGFWQEWVYRGILQNVLVQRWGVIAGVLVANLAFTFGPLHVAHFFARDSSATALISQFGTIFLIGLFFGVVLARSGNLILVGFFHGIGNVFILGARS